MSDLLLVDDDARIAELFAFFLRRAGHEVRTAGSFVEARASIASRRPDLLLSDLDLRVERGLEVLPQMSRAGELPPTLLVSGWIDAHSREDLEALPEIVGALKKPFQPEALVAAVERALAAAGELRDTGWIEVSRPECVGEP